MPRNSREDAAVTRKKLLDVALNLFYEKGVGAVSVVEIAREAHFTKGALYRHFDGKKGLLKEFMGYVIDRIDDIEEDCIAQSGSSLERLLNIAEVEVNAFETELELQRLFSVFLEHRSQVEDPELLKIIQSIRDKSLSRYYSLLKQARKDGDLPAHIDLKAASEGFRILIWGLMERTLYSNEGFSPSTLLGPIMDFYIRGVRS